MSTVLRVSSGGVPPGSYLAKFLGVEDTHNDEYGPGFRWIFEIITGPKRGAGPLGSHPTARRSRTAAARCWRGSRAVR
jgi:hypothetical protein